MSILKVARMGHPVLRTRAQAIERADIKSAAVQPPREVPGALRFFVAGFDPSQPEPDDDQPLESVAIINPEITPLGDEMVEDWEGCLSIPDIRGRVPRLRDVGLRAYDRNGERFEVR